jgi:Uma2 family endonuclease
MVMVPELITQRRLTLADYEQMPDDQDYEIIEGLLYVAPRARARHQIVANRTAVTLTLEIEQRGLSIVIPDTDLIVDEQQTYVSPDIMVFLGDRFSTIDRDSWIRAIPDLIVEVISPASIDYDRRTKFATYARLGVRHYWISDPQRNTITECVLQPDGTYDQRSTASPSRFKAKLDVAVELDLEQLFR